MKKAWIQIPDELFREAKRIAAENEMSFAEVVRRGLEEIIRHHPTGRGKEETWTALCHELRQEIFTRPLTAPGMAAVCQAYRKNPA